MKERTLEDHELVQAGDHYFSNGRLANPNATSFIGMPQSDWTSGHRENQWRRPVKEHNWISFKDRKPTENDGHNAADVRHHILVRGSDQVIHFSPFGGVEMYFPDATHWMPLNFVEDEPARIKVDGKEIVPQKDGSVKLSCGTIIPKEDVKEFIRQYNEVAK